MDTNREVIKLIDDNSSSLVWVCGPTGTDIGQDPRLRADCPKMWENLSQTGVTNVRYCEVCNCNVHLCESTDRFEVVAIRDEGIALKPLLYMAAQCDYNLRLGRMLIGPIQFIPRFPSNREWAQQLSADMFSCLAEIAAKNPLAFYETVSEKESADFDSKG